MDFTRQGNMAVNSMFPTCFNPGNLLLSFQTNFYRIISWKLAIFHSDDTNLCTSNQALLSMIMWCKHTIASNNSGTLVGAKINMYLRYVEVHLFKICGENVCSYIMGAMGAV